jgi:hypothetical protein
MAEPQLALASRVGFAVCPALHQSTKKLLVTLLERPFSIVN